MDATSRRPRDVAIPSVSFSALRRTLLVEAGPLVATHALQSAGYEAGMELYEVFEREAGGDPSTLGRTAYFDRLGRFLGTRGWGTLRYRPSHPAIGLLTSTDWAETADAGEETDPVCAYSSGMLSALLTRTAGAPVAVLQVRCRARGDGECAFAFGSEASVHALHGFLLDEHDLESAFAALEGA